MGIAQLSLLTALIDPSSNRSSSILYWARVINDPSDASILLLLSIVCIWLAVKKNLGHKVLLWLTGVWFGLRSLMWLAITYDLARNQVTSFPMYLHALVNASGTVLVFYVYFHIQDIHNTLDDSEQLDRVYHLKTNDETMKEILVDYLSETNSKRTQALANRYKKAKNSWWLEPFTRIAVWFRS